MDTELPLCIYRSAGGVVVGTTGDLVLVLLRSKRLDADGLSEIRLPKGHIEPAESRREAALREVREESGLVHLKILADLGETPVSFTWDGMHYLRYESYFLMTVPSDAGHDQPEKQFERLWLPWEDAVRNLTFEAEREWVVRAQSAWSHYLEDIPDQDTKQTHDYTQVEEKITVSEKE